MKKHKKLLRQQAANQDSSVRILRLSRETQSYVGCAGQGAPNFIIDLCEERLRDDGSVAKRLGCMLDVVFLSNKARASATLFFAWYKSVRDPQPVAWTAASAAMLLSLLLTTATQTDSA